MRQFNCASYTNFINMQVFIKDNSLSITIFIDGDGLVMQFKKLKFHQLHTSSCTG